MGSHGSVAVNMTLEQPRAKSRFAVFNSATKKELLQSNQTNLPSGND